VQLVFDAVAGAAALVALIVPYRRLSGAIAALDRIKAQVEETRVFNEPSRAAGAQIGGERAAIQLAGVRAIAGLADDWPEYRQACVAVLCAYLRVPNSPDTGPGSPPEERLQVGSARDGRCVVLKIITAHLRPTAEVSWRSLDFDFTGVVFDGGDFSGAEFSGGEVSFAGVEFPGGEVSFAGARFSGGEVSFAGARFSGAQAGFAGAEFSGSQVSFTEAEFSAGKVSFAGAEFTGGEVEFRRAKFTGGEVSFHLLPPLLFEHPAAELSVDDSAQLCEDRRQPGHIA